MPFCVSANLDLPAGCILRSLNYPTAFTIISIILERGPDISLSSPVFISSNFVSISMDGKT